MIHYRHLHREALRAEIEGPAFALQPHLPISRIRAWAQLHNPRAEPDDVLLIVAEDPHSGQLAGYLGLLPDWLRTATGQWQKIGWMTCIWTHPDYRGQGLAEQLVRQALQAYHGQVAATEFTAPARRLYDKLGAFADLACLHGQRWYRRFDLWGLWRQRLPRLAPLLRLADTLGNVLTDWRFGPAPALPPQLELAFVSQLLGQAAQWVEAHRNHDLFARSATDLNWMLAYPWLSAGTPPDRDSRRYAFSSQATQFTLGAVEVYQQGQLRAVLVYSLRDGHFKLPHWYADQSDLPLVAQVLKYLWKLWRVRTATLYQPPLIQALGRAGALYVKPFARHYLLGCDALTLLPPAPWHIHDGDGDAAFT